MGNEIEQWQYYNHAIIPTTPPHKTPSLALIENGRIWDVWGETVRKLMK